MSQHERGADSRQETPKIVDQELQKLARACLTDCYEQIAELLDFDQQDVSGKHPDLWFREMVGQARQASDLLMHIVQRLAIMGVVETSVSRKTMANLAGVHQGTIARWLKDPHQQHHGPNGPALSNSRAMHAVDLYSYTIDKTLSAANSEEIDKLPEK